MRSHQTRPTYRVRQISTSIENFNDVILLLKLVLDTTVTPYVHSLASSIDSLDTPPTKTATVSFEQCPPFLRESSRSEWIIPKVAFDLPYNLIIDLHFYGFTTLYHPEAKSHVAECIAISGLASHAFGSWNAHNNGSDFMWLRDAIPRRYPNMRVVTYGYNTNLDDDQSFQTIHDIALALVTKIRAIGLADISTKPLILIAHSLGGIIVKQALILMASMPATEATFLSKVREVIFLGVPNKGMQTSHLLAMVGNQDNRALVENLSVASPFLASLDEQFFGITLVRNIRLISIYETRRSRTVQRNEAGIWAREGPLEILVDPLSAIQRGTQTVDQLPINKDHSNLAKFSEGEDALGPMLSFMKEIYENSAGLSPDMMELDAVEEDSSFAVRRQATQKSFGLSRSNSRLSFAAEPDEIVQLMLECLNPEETAFRYESVEFAHHATLSWLMHKNSITLSEWLQNGEGLYWISGKPGSGKSTALKYIHARYCEIRSQKSVFRPQSTEITATFFFFGRGSPLQKSFEGLLRSLLYQALTASHILRTKVASFWARQTTVDDPSWAMWQLESAWQLIFNQTETALRITLFLDALDEFEGSLGRIVNFIEQISRPSPKSCTNVRICFTSRPWDIFVDHFSQYLGFRMEDHTRRDIQQYVSSEMRAHAAMRSLVQSVEPSERFEAAKLIRKIVDGADGVFVWVRMVLENVLNARTLGAGLDELNNVIESLPAEVEDLYATLLSKIQDPHHRLEAYIMLEIIFRAPKPLTFSEFHNIFLCASLVDLHNRDWVLHSLSPRRSKVEDDTFRRQIKSRCGGLIEVVSHRTAQVDRRHIYFMHQTLKDFVAGSTFRRILYDPTISKYFYNGHSFLTQSVLALVQGSAFGFDDVFQSKIPDYEWATRWFFLTIPSLHLAESTTGLHCGQFLDAIDDSAFYKFFFRQSYTVNSNFGINYKPRIWPIDSRLSFAAVTGMTIYLESHLMRQHSTANQTPLLFRIIENVVAQALASTLNTKFDHDFMPYNIETARLLLRYFPSATWENLTPIQALFRCRLLPSIATPQRHFCEMLKLLLEYGQNPASPIFLLDEDVEAFTPSSFTTTLHATTHTPDVLRVLLQYGANPNMVNTYGTTALNRVFEDIQPDLTSSAVRNLPCAQSAIVLITYGGKLSGKTVTGETRPWLRPYFNKVQVSVSQMAEVLNPTSDPRLNVTLRQHDQIILKILYDFKKIVPHSFTMTPAWREFLTTPTIVDQDQIVPAIIDASRWPKLCIPPSLSARLASTSSAVGGQTRRGNDDDDRTTKAVADDGKSTKKTVRFV